MDSWREARATGGSERELFCRMVFADAYHPLYLARVEREVVQRETTAQAIAR